MKGYNKLRKRILHILATDLPVKLYYHGLNHTLDVLRVCNNYIRREKIPTYDSKLLRLAVMLHDIGFSVSELNHEETSAQMARELMLEHQFTEKDISKVESMIMSTKLPQSPLTRLEEIICDADLDYLGRNDYYEIANLLFKELQVVDKVSSRSQWNQMQIDFLTNHSYHTQFARRNREPNKIKRIEELQLGLQ